MVPMHYARGGRPGPGHLVRFVGGARVGMVRTVDWVRRRVTVTFGTLTLEARPPELERVSPARFAGAADDRPRHFEGWRIWRKT